tara:strand:+ start:503 stop:1048 length:546 start_codon:yes stop_codon:yes gene_type:complete
MNYTGKLLIAHPNLVQNYFERSVIYICHDDPKTGSQGLILNKPSTYTVGDISTMKGFPSDLGELVRKGGPVRDKAICILHTTEWYSSNTVSAGQYSISSDQLMLEKISMYNTPRNWRIFSGICTWAPQQLDLEVKGITPYSENLSWLTLDAYDNIVFGPDGKDQWISAVNACSQQAIKDYF